MDVTCVLNSREDQCNGRYTRELLMTVAGAKINHQTTIDYVLMPDLQLSSVSSLVIDSNSGLVSDHKPLVLTLRWQPGTNHKHNASDNHLKWRVMI